MGSVNWNDPNPLISTSPRVGQKEASVPRRGDVCVVRQRTGGDPAGAVLERVGAPQSLPGALRGGGGLLFLALEGGNQGKKNKKSTTKGTQGSGTKDGFELGMGLATTVPIGRGAGVPPAGRTGG